ncbi:MAG: DNA primase [Bacteroidales bacterium]|jgi:DNA primase catalytic core
MIPQSIIDQIISIPIVAIIGKYATLKRKGTTWEACCPFHQEKSPSFKVFPKTNTYKCFGCGAGGNGIAFIMAKEGITFPEACRSLASGHGIILKEEEQSNEQKAAQHHAESLYIVNSLAGSYFTAQLNDPANRPAMDYALSRWTEETIKQFEIGFAPNKPDGLISFARQSGIKMEILQEAGLIRESENKAGQLYDFFRGRLIIPIHNKYGRINGFTARAMAEDQKAKYLNTPETAIYHKGKTLFGLNWAHNAIKEKGSAYLVEGNADAVRLHQIGIHETVAISGTAFTLDQIGEIKKLCNSITIIGDTDVSGLKAIDKIARLIIGEGMNCYVIRLPETEKKADPDNFFTHEVQFKEYEKANLKDYIIDLAKSWSSKSDSPDFKLRAINEISGLIVKLNHASHELYIDQVSKLIRPKKAWQVKLKELLREETPEIIKEDQFASIPGHVSLVDWERYGFYEDHNCYFFRTTKGILRGCNFTLIPLFHIVSKNNAKRLYQITNEHGVSMPIELKQSNLISLGQFKESIESLGNFLWEVSDSELNKLKRYLYQETKSCLEITQLGWHKDGFYSWGNGIFHDTFTQVDDYGIATHDQVNYYLPAFSKIYSKEFGLFVSERQFLHRDNNSITLNDYSQRLITVFGSNASVALCFYFASLFRDVIIRKSSFFPILDLFGPKGAGKTELAVSIMSFFGRMGKGPNINNTSKAALADHVAQLANACVHIDEYKNSIDFDKVEFLKGLWDGTGRTRMNMDKDKKKETTAVDCAVILSGQEMPTADNALFSRLIYLTFSIYEYDDEAKKSFNELKEIEKLGNTHITNQLLSLRKHFIANYSRSYDQVSKDLNAEIGDVIIEDRIFRNWLLILATFHAIQDKIEVPFTYTDLIKLSAIQIQIQNKETKKSNEVSTFWSIISYLAADSFIQDTVDYKIELLPFIKTDLVERDFVPAVRIISIQMSRVFMLYRKHGKQAGDKILPTESMDYYLKHDKRFLGRKRTRFRFIDTTIGPTGEWRSRTEHAYCFLYDDLGVSLHTENSSEDSSIINKTNKPKNLDQLF